MAESGGGKTWQTGGGDGGENEGTSCWIFRGCTPAWRIMSLSPSDYEKLGQFYLGREYDLDRKQIQDDLILYDSKDLVTHGVVLGMTGSGKTGLCLALLEEAAMDNIPAIVIDPKGDISNLMLAFPEMSAASFRPWINEDDATKKGITADDYAQQTAAMWQNGLVEWGQSAARVATFRDKVDINIFTPGSKAGLPVSILASLDVPPVEVMDDGELLGERIESTVSSLLSLVGVVADAVQSPEATLLAALFQHAWAAGRAMTLESLVGEIQRPPFDKVGVMDLNSFLSEKSRQALAMKFNNLLASPGFSSWLEGEPLDLGKMLHDPSGKPRISIFSIAHLGDAERMFFVSLLLNQMLGWMRSQKGTTSLRALLYMDEIYGYLPPSANPPSKKPMMTLLKQGRAFGIGCLLATQNPVDLDYKALSNIGTWFLGRLQTERDKMRVLDGLEGAAGSQNAKFDRASMERLISGLGNRIFLMNNVHEDAPVVFHVRWVMSYLAGPLTRGQIKMLMDPKRTMGAGGATQAPAVVSENPMAMPGMSTPTPVASTRPVVGAGVNECFGKVVSGVEDVIYQPHLLREGTVYFRSSKSADEETRVVRLVNAVGERSIDWDNQVTPPAVADVVAEPTLGVGYATLPGYVMNADNYKQVAKDFAEWLYRNQRTDVFTCAALKITSAPGESEADFRARISHRAREVRDEAIEKLRATAAKKIETLETRLRTAEGRLEKEKAEANVSKMQVGVSVLGSILGGLLGRKRGMGVLTSGASAITKAGSAYKQQQDVTNAVAKVSDFQAEIDALRQEVEQEVQKITETSDACSLALETESLKPARTDVKVDRVALLWLPCDARG